MECKIINRDYGKNKRRIFTFGKIDYTGCGRKINEVTLEVTLYADRNGYPEFTACADVWNNLHTDIVAGGQMLDELFNSNARFRNSTIYKTILDLWNKYHIKDVTNIPEDDKKKMDILFSDLSRAEMIEALKSL